MHLFLLKGFLNEPSAIEQFSKEYIVVVQLVKNYVCHLQNLQLKKKKREESRKKLQKEEKSKTYDDYNWLVMYREGQLKKFKVSTLDLYLDKHGINCSRSTLKKDKVDIVTADIARSLLNEVLEKEDDDEGDEASEDEQEFEDDVVLEEIGDNSDDEEEATDAEEQTETDDSESDGNENFDKDEDIADDDNDNSDSGDLEISDILCTTKSGRTCRTWRGRYLYY